MSNEMIYVDPRQEAVLRYDEVEVSCRSVPEAWLAWAQLDLDQKMRATIEFGDQLYGLRSIRRLRYEREQDAA
jgi:hypothetical protein